MAANGNQKLKLLYLLKILSEETDGIRPALSAVSHHLDILGTEVHQFLPLLGRGCFKR